jgi:hypothetical protein
LDGNFVLEAEIIDTPFAPIEKRRGKDSVSIAIAGQQRIQMAYEMF